MRDDYYPGTQRGLDQSLAYYARRDAKQRSLSMPIDTMTDEQRRMRVAELMGYTLVMCAEDDDYDFLVTDSGASIDFDPDNDMNDAIALAEHLECPRGWQVGTAAPDGFVAWAADSSGTHIKSFHITSPARALTTAVLLVKEKSDAEQR